MSKVEIKVEKLAPGVAVLFGSGGNIGLSYGVDGNIIIDDQFAPLTDKIIAAIKTVDPDPVKFVINTHWHFDHVGGNENFGKAGAVIVALLVYSKMTTVVDAAGVHVRYFPYLCKTFPLADLAGWEVKTYSAMEYGGWGVRGFPGRYGWAYIVRGNRGVELEFANGNRLMLGSQRAEELARAIEETKQEGA